MERQINIKELSKRLKEKRSKERLSLRDLAAHCNVSFSTIARIERMEGVPDIETVIKISKWVGMEMENYPTNAHIKTTKMIDHEMANALKQLTNIAIKAY